MNTLKALLQQDYAVLIPDPCRSTTRQNYLQSFVKPRKTFPPLIQTPFCCHLSPPPRHAPSAARVRSRVNWKYCDWLTGDKIIVVLLCTCGLLKFIGDESVRNDLEIHNVGAFWAERTVEVNTSGHETGSFEQLPTIITGLTSLDFPTFASFSCLPSTFSWRRRHGIDVRFFICCMQEVKV